MFISSDTKREIQASRSFGKPPERRCWHIALLLIATICASAFIYSVFPFVVKHYRLRKAGISLITLPGKMGELWREGKSRMVRVGEQSIYLAHENEIYIKDLDSRTYKVASLPEHYTITSICAMAHPTMAQPMVALIAQSDLEANHSVKRIFFFDSLGRSLGVGYHIDDRNKTQDTTVEQIFTAGGRTFVRKVVAHGYSGRTSLVLQEVRLQPVRTGDSGFRENGFLFRYDDALSYRRSLTEYKRTGQSHIIEMPDGRLLLAQEHDRDLILLRSETKTQPAVPFRLADDPKAERYLGIYNDGSDIALIWQPESAPQSRYMQVFDRWGKQKTDKALEIKGLSIIGMVDGKYIAISQSGVPSPFWELVSRLFVGWNSSQIRVLDLHPSGILG